MTTATWSRAGRLGDLPRDPPHHVRVETDLATAEGLAGELEQHRL